MASDADAVGVGPALVWAWLLVPSHTREAVSEVALTECPLVLTGPSKMVRPLPSTRTCTTGLHAARPTPIRSASPPTLTVRPLMRYAPFREGDRRAGLVAGLLASELSPRRPGPPGPVAARACGEFPRSQWRARAGLSPVFPSTTGSDGCECGATL